MSFTKAKKTPSSSSSSSEHLSPSISLQNIKPYLNNQSIVSYGNKNLDDILHGGHLVGTVTLTASDSYTNYADLLLYYEMNEAIVHQHKILLISPSVEEANDFIQSLPMNLNKNSQFQKSSKSDIKVQDESESGSENLSVEDKMKYLKNAWQYGKYIKDPPSTNSANSYCSSYDLSQRLQKEILEANYPRVFCPSVAEESDLFNPQAELPSLQSFLQSILTAVTSFQKVYASTNQPIRIFLHRFAGLTSQGFDLCCMESKRLLNRFALRLKHLVSRPSPHLSVPQSTLTVTIQKDLQTDGFYRILETVLADTHLSLESFAGKAESVPIEYRYFCGFLLIHKIQQVQPSSSSLFLTTPSLHSQLGSIFPFRPSACKYGLKRDRRKLHIEPLHLPPEDSRASKYHPEAGNAPSLPQPSLTTAPPVAVSSSRQETKATNSKLGALCSPQIGNRLDF